MYILAPLLFALIVYAAATFVLGQARRGPRALLLMTGLSVVFFVALIAVFIRLSLLVGVDVGPGHPVSYSIPDDYTARGLAGTIVMLVLAVAALAPLFGLGATLRMMQSHRG